MEQAQEIRVDGPDYSHPLIDGNLYGSAEGVKQALENKGLPYREEDIRCEDHRSSLLDVAKWIEKTEGHVWDEYVSVGNWEEEDSEKRRTALWPSEWSRRATAVFVVTGGSEGLYLHVEVIDGKTGARKLLVLGKTLNCSRERWTECWASAGRIARLLGA
jgi:hypothetical protein